MAVVIRRRALVELSAAYQEVIDHIRNSLCDGLRLEKGETAVARARKILYTTLYPDMQNQKKMTSRFNYEIRRAAPYYQLRQHYNNDGILAMVPSRFFEGTIQLAPRIPVMIQILDILRPDLREGTGLSFFSKLISMIFEDAVPDPGTLTELDKWTSVDNVSIRWLPDIDPALAAVGDAEFPVNGLYRSETERAMLFNLAKDDREEILSQRYENLHRRSQQQVVGVGCCLDA